MAKIICKYLSGVCYICQKCLYCFELLQKNLCTCEKNIKPLKISNPKSGQQIYHRAFTPSKLLLSADLFYLLLIISLVTIVTLKNYLLILFVMLVIANFNV